MEQRARILVVENKKSYLAMLARRLTEAGFRVAAAETASAAIAELHRLPIDLVLAELDLPGTSGAELARMIRGQVQWNDVPIMLITGRSEPRGAVRGYEAGAEDVILKPFHFEVLAARIERRLARALSFKRLRDDNATLDARVIERAIQVGELKDRLMAREAELTQLRRSA